jgi:two-component system, NarL family, nitrate/nitrite response regulator NarL
MTAIRVVVVDDHPLFRDGVIYTLRAETGIDVVGSGGSAQDAIRLAGDLQPDVMVLDMNMPGDGIAAVGAIAASFPHVAALMLTVVADGERVRTAIQKGAKGYILKGVGGRELVDVVRALAQGQSYVSPGLAAELLSGKPAGRPEENGRPNPFLELTLREEQILCEIGNGLSNKEIAGKLYISEKTVKHYVTGVLLKLRVRNRVEAALMISHHSFGSRSINS